jgi:hypothetical protein
LLHFARRCFAFNGENTIPVDFFQQLDTTYYIIGIDTFSLAEVPQSENLSTTLIPVPPAKQLAPEREQMPSKWHHFSRAVECQGPSIQKVTSFRSWITP